MTKLPISSSSSSDDANEDKRTTIAKSSSHQSSEAFSEKLDQATRMSRCSVIGSSKMDGMDLRPSLPTQQSSGRQTVGGTTVGSKKQHESLVTDDDEGADSSEDLDEKDHMMPGVLSADTGYVIKRDLVQGWVHKKGTGMDWIGSRAWKARWAVLSLARIHGQNVDTPLLQIYWLPSSPTPSTVIRLDSTVVMPEDGPDFEKWNCYKFKIQHVKKTTDLVQVTRTFSCPREGRDAWVYSINQALLDYEKEKAKLKRLLSAPLSPPRQATSMAWTSESFPTANDLASRTVSPVLSPPTSPRSSACPGRHPLPRPEHLLFGEAILSGSKD